MTSKRQRLVFVSVLAALMVAGFALLAIVLRTNLNGYQTPSDVLAQDLIVGQVLSVGGLVVPGSLQAIETPLGSRFVVADALAELQVVREGSLPDLFAEGELTQVQGPLIQLDPLTLSATKVLAKHDQFYVPVTAQRALDAVRANAPSPGS